MIVPDGTLKLALRKTGLGRENDYVIRMDGKTVGRIMQQEFANRVVAWTWSLTDFGPQHSWMRGNEQTLDEAKVAARAAIERICSTRH
jgi:hypothetical protein